MRSFKSVNLSSAKKFAFSKAEILGKLHLSCTFDFSKFEKSNCKIIWQKVQNWMNIGLFIILRKVYYQKYWIILDFSKIYLGVFKFLWTFEISLKIWKLQNWEGKLQDKFLISPKLFNMSDSKPYVKLWKVQDSFYCM